MTKSSPVSLLFCLQRSANRAEADDAIGIGVRAGETKLLKATGIAEFRGGRLASAKISASLTCSSFGPEMSLAGTRKKCVMSEFGSHISLRLAIHNGASWLKSLTGVGAYTRIVPSEEEVLLRGDIMGIVGMAVSDEDLADLGPSSDVSLISSTPSNNFAMGFLPIMKMDLRRSLLGPMGFCSV